MPAQGQKSWDTPPRDREDLVGRGRNACPGAEILGLLRRTWTRERTPTSRNACPGAEILGLRCKASHIVAMPAQVPNMSWISRSCQLTA